MKIYDMTLIEELDDDRAETLSGGFGIAAGIAVGLAVGGAAAIISSQSGGWSIADGVKQGQDNADPYGEVH